MPRTRNADIREAAKLWRIPRMDGLELLRAKYVTQTFSRHAHEGFAVGVIESGALGFHYRGENVVAAAGAINLAIPDQPHTGHAAVETGWSYRMFYLDVRLLEQAVAQMAGKPCGQPFFSAGVLQDPHLAATIRETHITMERGEDSLLENQSRLLDMLVQLIRRHAHPAPGLRRLSRDRVSVRRIRDYLEAYHAENPSIQDLANVAGLSPYHLIRVFQQATGLPPHVYLNQVRIRHARLLLSEGRSIADVAYATGFADQSHLTRRFKHIVGITPGQYRNSVQDRG